MGEILGLGMTHFPPLGGRDEGMAELGHKPTETAWIETHIFNSNKCFASFRP